MPHFVEPKFLSFILAVHDGKTDEKKDDENSSGADDNICDSMPQIPQFGASKQSDKKSNSEKGKPIATANDESPTNQPVKKLPELSEIKKFGSVEVIPVTNATKFEIKMHQQLIKNTIEITALLPDPSFNTPPEKMTYSPMKESIDSMKNSAEPTESSNVKLDDNVPVPEQCVDISKTCDGQTVNKATEEKNCTNNNKENNVVFEPTDHPADAQVFASKRFEKEMKSNENAAKHINRSVIEAEIENQSTNSVNPQKIATDNLIAKNTPAIENLESVENIANEKELTDELFGHFPLPQTLNESNPNTLSPTAAFLLSFPVVSTASSSKPTESEITFSDEKQNQSKDHNLFESISSILNDLNEVPDGGKMNESSNDIHFSYCSSKGKLNSCAVVGSQLTHSTHSNKKKAKSNTRESFSKAMAENNESTKNENSQMLKERFVDIGKPSVSKITKNETKQQSSAEISPSLPFHSHHLTGNKSAPKSTLPITSHSNENHSDFYESLSTLGLPTKSTLASTSTNNTVSSPFNFQISSLTQPRNIIESRALIADPPFTFSLTKSTETVTTTSSITQTQTSSRMNKIPKKLSPAKQTTNDHFCIPSTDTKIAVTNRNNTYNPFSFDNPPVLSTSSSMSLPNFNNNACSAAAMSTSFTFTLTPTFSTVPANAPLLSNADSLYSSSVDMPLSSVATVPSKHLKKDRFHVELTPEKMSSASSKNSKHFPTSNSRKPVKNHVNWMTSCMSKPVIDSSSEFGLISHASSIDDHSAWSDHHRIVDNAHFITTPALPMLQGDLALNTISNTVCSNVQRLEVENRKLHSKAISPIKAQSKQSINRKVDYSSAGNKFNKIEKNSLIQAAPAIQSIRSNENQSTNNFHSVSQLLDQDRQTTNKMNYFNVIDDKQQSKDPSFHAKQKFNSKYDENNSNNHQFNDKFALHSSGAVNNVVSNDCDREIFGGYLFSQSKRLKLNYSSSDYTNGNQSGANNYDNSFSNANDIHPPYTNYQTYDNEFNAGNSSCMNQTYPYQYGGQTQAYQSHQQYHTSHMNQNPTESIDSIILPQNLFQTPATLSNVYKPPNFTEMVRTNTKPNTIQPSHSNHSKSLNQSASSSFDTKSMLPPATTVHINDMHASHPSAISSNSLNKSPCKNVNNNPTKSMSHFTSHSNSFNNLNNLTLNQSWNDSFSWIPYSNSIEKPYNCNLFNNNENSPKTFNSNNINHTNNTIPNFNLTTIFPDCNKS